MSVGISSSLTWFDDMECLSTSTDCLLGNPCQALARELFSGSYTFSKVVVEISMST